ncbi:MAG: enoyl-CoA hydratase-related protein [Nocardioidaceae bacterium]
MSVRMEVEGEVLVVTLDRPKANAIDVATSLALYDAFERLQQDTALRVAVLTGSRGQVLLGGLGPQGCGLRRVDRGRPWPRWVRRADRVHRGSANPLSRQ